MVLVFGTSSVAATAPAREAKEAVIVVFRDRVANANGLAHALGRQNGFAPRHVYEHAIKGFAASLSARAVDALSRNPNVASIEADGPVWLVADQLGATWGLDRIDERLRPLDGDYTYEATGAGVTAYIIDTGIRFSHSEFGGRASSGFDSVNASARSAVSTGFAGNVASSFEPALFARHFDCLDHSSGRARSLSAVTCDSSAAIFAAWAMFSTKPPTCPSRYLFTRSKYLCLSANSALAMGTTVTVVSPRLRSTELISPRPMRPLPSVKG